MPPPSEKLKQAWTWGIGTSDELKRRWGDQIPIDQAGNLNRDAIKDLHDVTTGKQLPFKLGPQDFPKGGPPATREQLGIYPERIPHQAVDLAKTALRLGTGLLPGMQGKQQGVTSIIEPAIDWIKKKTIGEDTTPFKDFVPPEGPMRPVMEGLSGLQGLDQWIMSPTFGAAKSIPKMAYFSAAPSNPWTWMGLGLAGPKMGFGGEGGLSEGQRLYKEARDQGKGRYEASQIVGEQVTKTRREEPYDKRLGIFGYPREMSIGREALERAIYDPFNVFLPGQKPLSAIATPLSKVTPRVFGKELLEQVIEATTPFIVSHTDDRDVLMDTTTYKSFGLFKVPILGFSEDLNIKINSTNIHPMTISSIEFVGKFKFKTSLLGG